MVERKNEKKIRKIGVLTSGGDAPGMNAAIRAVSERQNIMMWMLWVSARAMQG